MNVRQLLALLAVTLMTPSAIFGDSIDANGVISFTDPNVEIVLGPMIAYGYNLWGYADERERAAVDLQLAGNPYYATTAHWRVPGTGTISHYMTGIGPFFGQTEGTTLCGTTSCNGTTCSSSATVCSINDATKIPGLQALPTIVNFYSPSGVELVLVTACTDLMTSMACTGGSTTAALTVGYDGRGLSVPNDPANQQQIGVAVTGAVSHANGSGIGEFKVTGSSTLFATDPDSPICPAGAVGPIGEVAYSTGFVQLSTSSTAVLGVGTTWNTGNGVEAGDAITIAATHGGGTPFQIWGVVSVLGSTTSITLSRATPSDVDTMTNFSYKIVNPMAVSLEFADPSTTPPHVGGTLRYLSHTKICLSETKAFGELTYGFASWPGALHQTSSEGTLNIGYKTVVNAQAALGPNFYGTGFACYQHYRATLSTYTDAETCSDQIDNWWIQDPEFAGFYGGQGSFLLTGGGVIAAFSKLVLDPTTTLDWGMVRSAAYYAATSTFISPLLSNCNFGDTRDRMYGFAWIALAAKFDPDSAWKAQWETYLSAAVTIAQNCRRNVPDYTGVEEYSFGNAGATGPLPTAISFADGTTTTATGTGFTAGLAAPCRGNFVGTIQFTNGSTAATVISTTSGALGNTANDIRLWATDSGGYTGHFQYTVSGSDVTLAGEWAGLNGTYDAMAETSSSGDTLTALADGSAFPVNDTLANNQGMRQGRACKVINNTTALFDRPVGGGGGTFYAISYILPGFNQQPFMHGIATKALKWCSQSDDATIAANCTEFLPHMGGWMFNYGYDEYTFGTRYGTVTSSCYPFSVPNSVDLFVTIEGLGRGDPPGCGYSGLLPGTAYVGDPTAFQFTARVATSEALASYIEYYLADPTPTRKAAIDKVYGAVFGRCSLTTGGGYCDSHYVNQANQMQNGAAGLGGPKWTGFFFGMGMARQWPAIRVQDIPPAAPTGVRYSAVKRYPSGGRR